MAQLWGKWQPYPCNLLASQRQAPSGPRSRGTPRQLWAAAPPSLSPDSAFWLALAKGRGVCENHRVYRSSWCHRVVASCTAPPNQSRLGQSISAAGKLLCDPQTSSCSHLQGLFCDFQSGTGQRWSPVCGDSFSLWPATGELPFSWGSCSLGNPTSLLHSSGRTYSDAVSGRRHPHLVLALLFTMGEGDAKSTPSQT